MRTPLRPFRAVALTLCLALPLLAACLLTADECVLTNVPRIIDVEVMARLAGIGFYFSNRNAKDAGGLFHYVGL